MSETGIHRLIGDQERIGRVRLFCAIAKLVSLRGTCKRPAPGMLAGAVITIDNRIVSIGYVGSAPGDEHCIDVGCDIYDGHCIRTTHAEANAILWAARKGISLDGGVMYCTVEPCLNCAKMMVQAGIRNIWYLHEYGDGMGIKYLQKQGVVVNMAGLSGVTIDA